MDRLCIKWRPADTNDVRYVTVVIRTSESEGDNAHLKKYLFVYILAFLADGVLRSFSKLFLFSGYSLTYSNELSQSCCY